LILTIKYTRICHFGWLTCFPLPQLQTVALYFLFNVIVSAFSKPIQTVQKIRPGLNTYRLSQHQSSAMIIPCLSSWHNISISLEFFPKIDACKTVLPCTFDHKWMT